MSAGAGPNAPPLPAPGGRGGLLADIRGGARLKKVGDQEKRDRSAAALPGDGAGAGASAGGGSAGAGAGGGAGDGGGLASALANALAVRKSKVSQSGEFSSLCFSFSDVR